MENIESSWNILMDINFKILFEIFALKNFKINIHQSFLYNIIKDITEQKLLSAILQTTPTLK